MDLYKRIESYGRIALEASILLNAEGCPAPLFRLRPFAAQNHFENAYDCAQAWMDHVAAKVDREYAP